MKRPKTNIQEQHPASSPQHSEDTELDYEELPSTTATPDLGPLRRGVFQGPSSTLTREDVRRELEEVEDSGRCFDSERHILPDQATGVDEPQSGGCVQEIGQP